MSLIALLDGPEHGDRAMARDEILSRRQRRDPSASTRIVRIHGWTKPTVTLGRGQRPSQELRRSTAVAGLELVRRPTGGGWLLHQPGDLAVSYAVAGPLPAGGLRRTAQLTAQAIALGLSAVGKPAMVFRGEQGTGRADTCFSRVDRDEVIVDQTKVAGVALCRFGRGALVQAAIPISPCRPPILEWSDQWDPARAEAVSTLQGIDKELLRRSIIDAFGALLDLEPRTWFWPGDWLREAEQRRQVYADEKLADDLEGAPMQAESDPESRTDSTGLSTVLRNLRQSDRSASVE